MPKVSYQLFGTTWNAHSPSAATLPHGCACPAIPHPLEHDACCTISAKGPSPLSSATLSCRHSQEKGLDTLLAAWRQLKVSVPLKIVGDGPLALMVQQAVAVLKDVEWLGPRIHEEVLRLMADAAFQVVPNNSYETFGMVAMEAFAVGLPVFASRLGALAELVSDGKTGKLLTAGSSEALAATVEWAIAHPDELRAMRRNARIEFESRYTADANYSQLMRIYESARAENRASKSEAK